MGYVVRAKQVMVLVPGPMWIGRRQVHESATVREGFPLPAGVAPHVIANLLESGAIEEVADTTE